MIILKASAEGSDGFDSDIEHLGNGVLKASESSSLYHSGVIQTNHAHLWR